MERGGRQEAEPSLGPHDAEQRQGQDRLATIKLRITQVCKGCMHAAASCCKTALVPLACISYRSTAGSDALMRIFCTDALMRVFCTDALPDLMH